MVSTKDVPLDKVNDGSGDEIGCKEETGLTATIASSGTVANVVQILRSFAKIKSNPSV